MKTFNAQKYNARMKAIVQEYRQALLDWAEINNISQDDMIKIESDDYVKTSYLWEELNDLDNFLNP